MATKNLVKKEENDVEIIEDRKEESVDFMSMLKKMQEEITSLRRENEEIKKSNNSIVVATTNKSGRMHPDTEVTIMHMSDCIAYTVKVNDMGATKRFNKFGQRIWVTLREARDIARLNDKAIKKGYIIFEDRDVIEELMLTEDYEKFIDMKTMESIQLLDCKGLEKLYQNSNESYREMIVDRFISGYIDGQDSNFRDRAKIDLLTSLSDIDIMTKIVETERNKNRE